MTTERPAPERRRYPRISPKGSVNFRAGGHEQRGRIANLSESGVFIVTSTQAPERLLARPIELEIRFDAGRARWLGATGHIVRVEATGIAVVFQLLASPLLRAVDELIAASNARARAFSVLVIDADPSRRSAMAAGFRAIGCSVVEVNTPLEAVVRLGESSFEPDAIVLPDSGGMDADEAMRLFLEQNHPASQLLTVTEDLLKPDGFAIWLASSNVDGKVLRRKRAGFTGSR